MNRSMRHFYWMVAAAFAAVLIASCAARMAHAQTSTVVTNGTIAVTNTFQSVLIGQNGGRTGCTIQNQGTHTMYVFPGAIGSATTAKSLQLSPGQIFMCGLQGSAPTLANTIQDAINLTGTAGDAFVVNAQ